jgi:hypothetical protein
VPARRDRGVPDLAADAHRGEPLRPRPNGCPHSVRIPARRVRVRGALGLHRRVGGRGARVHGDRQPGPALHGRGALQRLGARVADGDDGREPGDRRSDQHLERPLGRDVPARLGLDPALRRVEPRGARPSYPGVQARRGGLAPADGVHGRLRAHARVRAGGRSLPGGGRRVPAAVRAAPGARPRGADHDRRDGRTRRRSRRCAISRTPSRCRRST